MASFSSPMGIAYTPVRSWAKEVLVILLAANLIALTGPLALPLPFSPVPIGIQCHMILFMAVLLGSRRAAAAVAVFLLEGALGLPVFAKGAAGFVHLIGPTGGYLFGYFAAAFVTGLIAERQKETKAVSLFSAMAVGNLVVFLFGAGWLSQYIGVSKALILGIVPFIAGDVLKLVLATKTLLSIKSSSKGV